MPTRDDPTPRTASRFRLFTTRKRLLISHGVTALLFLAAGAAAGPIAQSKSILPGAIRSLAGLERVRLLIEPLPPEFRTAGMTPTRIRLQLTKALERAGLVVVAEEDVKQHDTTPVLAFQASLSSDPSVRDAKGILAMLKLEQQVRVTRLEAELEAPTCFAWALDVRSKETLAAGMRESIDSAANLFLAAVRLNER